MIRPYQPSDKHALLAILRLNTPAYFAPVEEKDFIQYLDHELDQYFVVEENGIVLGGGGINLQGEGKRAHISWDLFHPDAQGKGFGTTLTQYRLQKINEIPAVEKVVVRTSQKAYEFYRNFGFALTGMIKDYWAQGFDLYHMELVIV